jgi:hypothetical protein
MCTDISRLLCLGWYSNWICCVASLRLFVCQCSCLLPGVGADSIVLVADDDAGVPLVL